MRFRTMIHAVDTHTGGAPTRIIYSPLARAYGTMAETQARWQAQFDWIRKALMNEPRGYREMTGAVVTYPVNEGSSFGLLFIDPAGYMNMCGHAVVGAATALYELGMLPPDLRHVRFDTLAGVVTVVIETDPTGTKVRTATVQNVPSFAMGQVRFELDGRTLVADIAYGGNIFAILDASAFEMPLDPAFSRQWSQLGLRIRERLNALEETRQLTAGQGVAMVEFTAPPTDPRAHAKNLVVFGDGQVDREPCGTGTCAKMACLFEKGQLRVGESFVQESILGTLATARILGTTTAEGRKAISPEVSYSVFITGFHQYVFDDEDPLREGYLL